jgi:hypothetical protein
VLGVPGFVSPAHAANGPGETLRDYLRARMQGNLEAAEALWDPRDLRLSTALGIEFTDVEAGYDDYWMISAGAREARAARVQPVVQDSVVTGNWVHYTVVLQPRTESVAADTLSYLVKNNGGTWSVSLPFQEATADWTRRESRFIRVRTKKIVRFSQHALTAVDDEIARLFEAFEAPQAALLRLERIKLDYFLCDDEDDVRQLVGSMAREGYQPAAGRVVSRSLGDASVVVPLVVQLTLRKLPLHNEPLFEEGLPLALGGTATASAAVVLQRARNANLEGKNLPLVFEAGTAQDVALPLEALWNHILLESLGPKAFLELLRSTGHERSRQNDDDNSQALKGIEKSLAMQDEALWRWAGEQVRHIEPTVQPGCDRWPPGVDGLQAFLRWRDTEEQWSLQGYEVDGRYEFAVGPHVPGPPQWLRNRVDSLAMEYAGEAPEWHQYPPTQRPLGDPPPIFFLVRAKLEEDLEPYESTLFSKQFLSRDYRNDLWGFFVTPDDVKLYDYTQNKILAEYVAAESPPPEHTYYDEESGHLCFSLSASHFPRPLTAYYVFLGYYTGE